MALSANFLFKFMRFMSQTSFLTLVPYPLTRRLGEFLNLYLMVFLLSFAVVVPNVMGKTLSQQA